MKKILLFTVVIAFVFGINTGYAEYSYDFTTSIPQKVQAEAVEYMQNIIRDTSKDTKLYSYADLLDLYLRFYGIYSPVSINGGLVEWAQTELLKNPERIEYIPERYTRQGELSAWVTRYAEPGDLLLYRINGRADKCVIYAGNGKMIGRGIDNNKEMEIRATFADGESTRTKSGGLYAIAHMWMESEDKLEEEQYFDIRICMDDSIDTFSQDHYTLFEEEAYRYEKSKRFVLIEYKPGVYKIWNGERFGVPEQYIKEHDGVHFMIVAEHKEKMIGKQIKVSISASEFQSEKNEYIINAQNETKNMTQWNGSDFEELLQQEAEIIE